MGKCVDAESQLVVGGAEGGKNEEAPGFILG